ncbi:response regulator [Hydrogenophaga sp.]
MNQTTQSVTSKRSRVLIVDDDPNMVHVLARTLLDVAQLHFSVRGADALKKLNEHIPEVMLIDVDMPDLNGYEVMVRMRSNPALRNTRVIMVTSHNDESYRKRAMDLGAVDFFVKPINGAMVRQSVEHFLEPGDIEAIELSLSTHGDFKFTTDYATKRTEIATPASTQKSQSSVRSAAITSELFERMTTILQQTESIRNSSLQRLSPSDLHSISRIEEECAEVVQMLVTLSDNS